jgi:hypothetical protein
MITREEYIEQYGDVCANRKLDAGEVYDNYVNKVQPYLSVITAFRIGDERAREDQLALALYVNKLEFRTMKQTFQELEDALKAKQSVMKLKSMIDLQRGLIASEYKNAKMLDMQSTRYDDEYKVKDDGSKVEIPNTLDISIHSARLDDDERLEKSGVGKHNEEE